MYKAILSAIRRLEGSLPDAPRDVSMIAGQLLTGQDQLVGIEKKDVRKAIAELAGASQGALILDEKGEIIHITTSLDELERRVSSLTKSTTTDRRISSFRGTCSH
jgi:hypothetical protein